MDTDVYVSQAMKVNPTYRNVKPAVDLVMEFNYDHQMVLRSTFMYKCSRTNWGMNKHSTVFKGLAKI